MRRPTRASEGFVHELRMPPSQRGLKQKRPGFVPGLFN
jgi:hypothetical protein